MNILLTGATGFIGARLARVVMAADHHLVCAVRNPAKAQAGIDGASFVEIDFSQASYSSCRNRRLAVYNDNSDFPAG